MKISGRTRIAGLFGCPVEHTLSPVMQNAAFEQLGMDCCYLPFPVEPRNLASAVDAIRALSFMGVNLTIPHKETVLPLLDELDSEARAIGAVNTIVNRNGWLSGWNTDGKGFMRSLAEQGIEADGKRVLLVGAGGSSRALGYYLNRAADTLFLYNRSRQKAEALALQLSSGGKQVQLLGDLSGLREFDIVINATSLGLKTDDPAPFDPAILAPSAVVCDLIYHRTPLISLAEARGCKTVSGSGMLLWQGALAFELWTGLAAPVEAMRQALLESSH